MADASVLLIFAHPYPDRSIANRKLLDAVDGLPGVAVRSLYDMYPTFDIDVASEQTALGRAQVLVLQHPMYWYSVPSLLKHWFEKVLTRGFAYGHGGKALWGKRCLWVVTTGGDERAFSAHGMHGRPFGEFMPVVEQTASFCGMSWEEPLVVYGAHRLPPRELELAARDYRERLASLVARAERGDIPERPAQAAPLDAEPPADTGASLTFAETPSPAVAAQAAARAAESKRP
jgi:glutathione-regulated potassium-efflux system ancillary protein KefF